MRASRPLAAVVFALVVVVSYASQHLWALSSTAPTDGQVWGARTVPFYWRVYVATFQGVLAGSLVAWLVPHDRAQRWLERAPVLIVAVVLVTVGLSAWFPA